MNPVRISWFMCRKSCQVLCSSFLLLWQAFTFLAASTAVPVCSPSKWWSFSWSDSLGKFGVVHVILVCMWVLTSVYVSQCSSCSVSTCLCGQSRHSRSSPGSQACLFLPLSKARLWSLSLYIVKVFFTPGSVRDQIICHGVLSVKGQIALEFALGFGC